MYQVVKILKDYMEVNKITQKEMGKKLKVKQSTISKWMTEDNYPRRIKQCAIIYFLAHAKNYGGKIGYDMLQNDKK